MFKTAIYFALATLATAQWAFTVPDGDLGELAPGNNVRQGDVHNFKWSVGLENEPVEVLDSDGFCSLWITSGLDHSFSKLLATSVNSTTGGAWAWDTSILSDDDIDTCQGVFIYRLQRPVSSESATYSWDTKLSVSSVSFRMLKKSEAATTSAASTKSSTSQSTLATTGSATTNTASATSDSSSTASSATGTGAAAVTSGGSSSETPTTTPTPDNGLSVGAKAGIGIGAVGAAALLAIAGLLFYRQSRKRNAEKAAALQRESLEKEQRAYHGGGGGAGWAGQPAVVQQHYAEPSIAQQHYAEPPRAEMMDNARHEIDGRKVSL